MKDYTIYRVDLESGNSAIFQYVSGSAYDVVKEQVKLTQWTKRHGYNSAYIYRETSPECSPLA